MVQMQNMHHSADDCVVMSYSKPKAPASDKYNLDLRFANKHKSYLDSAIKSKVFQDWKSQSIGGYGFYTTY